MNNAEANIIKLITFDLGNVLVNVDHMEFCRRLAVLTPLTAEDIYNYVFNGSLEPEYDTGKMTSQEFYQQIITQFKVDFRIRPLCPLVEQPVQPQTGNGRGGHKIGRTAILCFCCQIPMPFILIIFLKIIRFCNIFPNLSCHMK